MSSLDIPSWPNPSGESLQTNHTTWISEVPDPRLVHEVDKVFGIRDILQSLLLSKDRHINTLGCIFFSGFGHITHCVTPAVSGGHPTAFELPQANISKETLDCENPSK